MGVLISKKVFCSRVMLDTNLFDEERRFRKRVFVYQNGYIITFLFDGGILSNFKTKSVENFKININGLQTMMTNSIVLTIFKAISKEYAIPIFFGTNSPIIR